MLTLSTPQRLQTRRVVSSPLRSNEKPSSSPEVTATAHSSLLCAKTLLCQLEQLCGDGPRMDDETYGDVYRERERAFEAVLHVLEVALKEENERQRVVLADIKGLKETIAAHCDLLGERHDLDDGASAKSAYTCRRELAAIAADLDKTIVDRRGVFAKLRERWQAVRDELGNDDDGETSESQMPSTDLSLQAMETAIGLVQELELQKSSRLESLAHATFELITISHSLSRPVPVLYQALLDSLPTEALTSPSSLLTHFTSLGLVPPLSLHRDCVRGLEAARQQIKAEYEQLLADVDAVVIEIRTVWDQMQVPHNERRDLPRDIQCLAEYRALVAALHKRWREKMEAEVNEMYARLRVLWLQCHVPESEQHAYDHDDDQDASWFYTPHTLAAMSADVARLTARYQRFRDIYALMDSRAALIARMVAFEKTASDPARLFRPSFQLMEEDRFRRSAYPTLLKTEQEIRDAVARVQSSDNGEKDVVVENVQVLWNGESVLETLKRECEARFVNAAVFVLDGTTQSKNAAGKQHAAAGGAKTTGAVIAPAAGPSDPSVNGRPSASPMHRRPAAATSANTPGRTTHSAKYRTLTPPSASQRKSPNSKPPALTSSPPTNLKMSNSSLPTTTSTGNTASASTANIPTASGLRRASSRSTKNQTSRSPGK